MPEIQKEKLSTRWAEKGGQATTDYINITQVNRKQNYLN